MESNDPNLRPVHDAVKPRVTRNRNEEIRDRLRARLEELGRGEDYAWVAAQTEETRTQIRKWVTGETDSFPATFAAKLDEAGVVSARYLLTGVPPREPVDPDEAVVRLEVIRLAANPADWRGAVQAYLDGLDPGE